MKHYDYVEWLLYKNKFMPEEKADEMEQHLYGCSTCMEIFLSLIDEKEEKAAGEILSEGFTADVVGRLSRIKTVKPKANQKKRTFNYQLGLYAAVASVTIILTFGGFYTSLVDTVPKLSVSVHMTKEYTNIIADFSEGIVSGTSNLLSGIENNDMNNRRRNNER